MARSVAAWFDSIGSVVTVVETDRRIDDWDLSIAHGGAWARAAISWAMPHPGRYQFRIQRSKISVQAPPERIFDLIQDFHQWLRWSPWEKLDPNMKKTYSGAACGKGAVYAWEGNSKAGAGRMEILSTVPGRRS